MSGPRSRVDGAVTLLIVVLLSALGVLGAVLLVGAMGWWAP